MVTGSMEVDAESGKLEGGDESSHIFVGVVECLDGLDTLSHGVSAANVEGPDAKVGEKGVEDPKYCEQSLDIVGVDTYIRVSGWLT